jgi:hypothetical protein
VSRNWGAKHPSKRRQRLALQAVLLARKNLDGLDLASLARCYRMTIPTVAGMVADERQRRNTGRNRGDPPIDEFLE